MQQKYEQLQKIKCFVFDMDGTIYLGKRLINGSLECLDYLQRSGRQYFFLTNNSSQNKYSYVKRLGKLGIQASSSQILTSGEATAIYLRSIKPYARIFLLGTPDLERTFSDYGFTLTCHRPEYVVLGFDQTLTYVKLAEACHLIREGVPFIATHPDINCPTDERSGLIPDVGAILELIYASTGKRPKVIGKPHQEMVDVLITASKCKENEIAMVGDRLCTDIKMANESNLCGILVLSGETKMDDLKEIKPRPDYIFKDIQQLDKALRQVDDQTVSWNLEDEQVELNGGIYHG